MKKIICMLLAALLLLSGCQASGGETTVPAAPAETTAAPVQTQVPETTEAETVPPVTLDVQVPEGELMFRNPGKARIAYTGSRSYVKYITCVEDLPDEEALKGYDEAFFEEHALVIVVETVNSGSIQLEIDSITVSGDTAAVSLKRTMSGDVGTADMATWMLWAEVEQGLDYTWVLKNGSALPGGEKY